MAPSSLNDNSLFTLYNQNSQKQSPLRQCQATPFQNPHNMQTNKLRKRRVTFAPQAVSDIYLIPCIRCVKFVPEIVTKVSEIPRYQHDELSDCFYSQNDLLMFLKDFIASTKTSISKDQEDSKPPNRNKRSASYVYGKRPFERSRKRKPPNSQSPYQKHHGISAKRRAQCVL